MCNNVKLKKTKYIAVFHLNTVIRKKQFNRQDCLSINHPVYYIHTLPVVNKLRQCSFHHLVIPTCIDWYGCSDVIDLYSEKPVEQ